MWRESEAASGSCVTFGYQFQTNLRELQKATESVPHEYLKPIKLRKSFQAQ